MDFSTIASIGGYMVGGAGAVFGWLAKRSISQLDRKLDAHEESIKEQSKALDAHKLHVAENYVNHGALEKAIEAFHRSIDAVFAKLERIEEKLDKKADK